MGWIEVRGALNELVVEGWSGRTIDHTGTGSLKEVQRYIAHPNEVKRLPDATAGVNLDLVAGGAVPAAMATPAVQEVPYGDLPGPPDLPGLHPI